MFNSNRFSVPIALAAFVAIPIFANGCSAASAIDSATSAACCTQFKVGEDMSQANFGVDASLEGSFDAFAQAAGDLAATADGMLTDVTAGCLQIASDLGADTTTVAAETGTQQATDACTLASNTIKALNATITVTFQPPVCSASVSAQANCDAHCSVNGSCDAKANPPTCTGGTLEVSCSGSCTASATAPSFDCTGSCSGNCTGSCSAAAGATVTCNGKCDGTCSATQADGSCSGTCSGTCTAKAGVSAQCSGTCSGKCDATCSASPGQASVQCGGTCSATATPISCNGGSLKASCQVDANCDANCSASASAKANCTAPQVAVVSSVPDLETTLEANLPKIIVAVQARGQAFLTQAQAAGTGGATIIADPSKLGVSGLACSVIIAGAVTDAVSNATTALSAGGTILTQVGAGT